MCVGFIALREDTEVCEKEKAKAKACHFLRLEKSHLNRYFPSRE